MKHFSLSIVFLLCCTLCLALSGCGNGHVSVSGKVIYSDDGSPVTFGTVLFAAPTFQAKGEINKDGTFTMGSIRVADGLPPNNYKVAILGVTEDTDGDRIYSYLDPKWTSPSTSGFSVWVEKTMRNLEIKVDRNPETIEQFKKKK